AGTRRSTASDMVGAVRARAWEPASSNAVVTGTSGGRERGCEDQGDSLAPGRSATAILVYAKLLQRGAGFSGASALAKRWGGSICARKSAHCCHETQCEPGLS